MILKASKKLLSLILVLALVLGLMPPVSGAAADNNETTSSRQVITSFADLTDDVAVQSTTFGTAKSELSLPTTLNAAVDSTPTDIDVTWVSDDYDGEAAAEYVFTAKISDEYQLADGVTLPIIIVTVQAAKEQTQEQTVTITFQKQDGSENLYFKENETIEEKNLLAGVSAVDEQGNALEVKIDDLGGLNPASPEYQSSPYTLTYAAVHPESGEKYTAVREVYVIGMGLRASDESSYTFDISEGDVIIESGVGSETLKVTYGSAQSTTNEFSNTRQITIIGSSTADNKISVKGGVNVSIILKDVVISNSIESPFQVLDSSAVELTLSGSNTLTCTNGTDSIGTYAGLYVASTASITIEAATGNTSDSLTAYGGVNGAGIGGSYIVSGSSGNNDAGRITVNSGNITAYGGGSGAGIGGGWNGAGGDITISGGKITANGGGAGAGIGGGWNGAGGDITISGGKITANGGGGGAGIGSGPLKAGGDITISGGETTANGGRFSAGIGGGWYGAGGDITISGGTIIATKGTSAPCDIGRGDVGSGGTIKIIGGSVCPTNGSVTGQPTNENGIALYLNILTVGSTANANMAITAGSVGNALMQDDPAPQNGYGINDVTTDSNGNVYFWLPQTDNGGTDKETVLTVADNKLYAATYERSSSPVSKTLELVTIADGNILITQFNNYYTVEIGSYSLQYNYSEAFTITGSSSENIVKVTTDSSYNSSEEVQIILKGVTISNGNKSPFQLLGSSKVELTLSGTNSLKCTNWSYNEGSYAGLYVAPNAKITITAETDDASLIASGGCVGAGIGGSYISNNDYSANAAGVINIDGGEVTATGGNYGAGIGGGFKGNGGEINITGGEVTASGGLLAAGIGGGYSGSGGTIAISGGTISATSGVFGPYDIGHGQSSSGSNDSIKITGGSVYPTNGTVSPKPTTDSGTTNVYLNTLTVGSPPINDDIAISSAAIDGVSDSYGIKDVVTMNSGTLYFWLPQNDSASGSVAITVTSPDGEVSGDTYGAAWARTGVNETEPLLKSPYEVTFDSNGGTPVDPQSVDFSDKVTEPTAPTRNGYIFDGWYSDNETFLNAWVFNSNTVTKPITLYAKWKDTTSPTGSILVRNDLWSEFINPITFNLFYKGKVEIKIIGNDAQSGIDTIEYIIAKAEMTLEELKNATWKKYSNVSFSVNTNSKFIIYARITDNEGNSTIISSDGIVRYTDSQQDTASISFTKTGTTNVTAQVTLNGNTVAGIRNGTKILNVDDDYSVDNSNGKITFKASYLNTLTAGSYTLTVSYQPLGIGYVPSLGNDAPAATTITLDIVKASQDISGVSDITKTYGDSDFRVKPNVLGNPEITFESSETDVATITQNGTITIIGAGETTITIKAAATDDYEATETTFKLTVEKAAITITANNQTITYGGALKADEYTVTGTLANDQSITAITLTPSETMITDRGTITPGDATIETDNGDDVTQNYSITYKTGILVINHNSSLAPEKITAVKTKTEYTVGDELNTDDLTVTAFYEDGYSQEVIGYTTNASSINMDTPGQKELTVTYKENGETITADIAITVIKKPIYTVTVNNGLGSGSYEEGAAVIITAEDPPVGKQFTGWKVDSENVTLTDSSSATTTFTMPAEAVTVTAEYAEVPPEEYSITVQNDGNGTAEADIKTAPAGTEITLSYTANEGYYFKEWQVVAGDIRIEDSKFTMPSENVTVKAIFEEDTAATYIVRVNNGTGSGSYEAGATVTITAEAPQDGKQFAGWTVDSQNVSLTDSSSETTTFIMSAEDVTVTAVYEDIQPEEYNITVQSDGNGTAEADVKTAESGTEATLSYTANAGYHFKEWQVIAGDIRIEDSKFTMPAEDVIVKAIFEKNSAATYMVTVNNGSGSGSYEEGSTVIITAEVPKDGKQFAGWRVDSENVTLTDSISATTTFTMPAEAVTVTAEYSDVPPGEYSITVQSDGSGTAEADMQTAPAGIEVTLSYTANEGYHFKEWQVIEGDIRIENSKFTMPSENITVKAIFEKDSADNPDVVYRIISGADETWIKGSQKGHTITSDGDFSKFTSVHVNGEVLDAENYEVKEGSTVVTMTKEYLETLSLGTYDFKIEFVDGTAETAFTIAKTAETGKETNADKNGTSAAKSTATGDNTSVGMLLVLLVLSGSTCGYILFRKRKKNGNTIID